jgi:hypothetical protein
MVGVDDPLLVSSVIITASSKPRERAEDGDSGPVKKQNLSKR